MNDVELMQRLIGVFHNYRLIMGDLGCEMPAFVISEEGDFQRLHHIVQRNWHELSNGGQEPPPVELLKLRDEEYYQFSLYGMRIRCLIPGAFDRRRRNDLRRQQEIEEYERSQIAMKKMPTPAWIQDALDGIKKGKG